VILTLFVFDFKGLTLIFEGEYETNINISVSGNSVDFYACPLIRRLRAVYVAPRGIEYGFDGGRRVLGGDEYGGYARQ